MNGDEHKHQCRDEEYVRRKEAAQGGTPGGVSRQEEVAQPVSDKRRASGLFGGNYSRPESDLIPTKELPSEGHQQGEEQ